MSKLKIGFFADGPWAHEALNLIHKDPLLDIQFICGRFSNEDRYLSNFAREHKINFFRPKNVNSREFIAEISHYNSTLFVSMSFDQIMKPSLFSIPKFGSINCHAGKLPFYRGRNVLNWVLINDEKEFGITVHFIDEGIDTGDIILQKVYPISDRDTYQTLLDKSFKECGIILHQAITNIQQGTFSRINQKDLHPVGSYCIQRLPGDEIIDWNQTTRSIFCFVRALSHPGPSATTFFKNSSVKIHRTEQVDSAQDYLGIPGSIVAVSAENFTVKTSDNLIRVTDWSGMSNPQVGWRFG